MANNKRVIAKPKKKKKVHLTKWIVPFVIVSIFIFTGLAMYVQIISGVELSAALITCFFAFCTGELWMLASIKKTKITNNFVDDPETPENEAEIYSEIYQQGYNDAMQQLKDRFFYDDVTKNYYDGGNGKG